MTFLLQVQHLLERTYASAGVNLEDCLIGSQRCAELSKLAGPDTQELEELGRTFLRVANGRLYVAIYYHPSVIEVLERHHPMAVLNRDNIRALIVFLEEMDHALHAALNFIDQRLEISSEDCLCELELQAKIDTYLTLLTIGATLHKRKPLTRRQRIWIQSCLFRQESLEYASSHLCQRYRLARDLGLSAARHLDNLESKERLRFIRRFRVLSFEEKRRILETL